MATKTRNPAEKTQKILWFSPDIHPRGDVECRRWANIEAASTKAVKPNTAVDMINKETITRSAKRAITKSHIPESAQKFKTEQ